MSWLHPSITRVRSFSATKKGRIIDAAFHFNLTEKALGLVSFVVVSEPCGTPIRLEKIRPSPSPSPSTAISRVTSAAAASVPLGAHPGERRLAQ